MLTKAREESFQKGREQGYADAREDLDHLMFRWFSKAVVSSSRLTKAQAEELREAMIREDVSTANDVFRRLRDWDVLDFDGGEDLVSDSRLA
jgi:hypothetical protein